MSYLLVFNSGEAQMWPKKWELLFIALWRILPEWVLFLLKRMPSRAVMRLKRFKDTARKVSRSIFEKQLIEVANDPNPSEKDIVNVLGMWDIFHQYQSFLIMNQRCLISPMTRRRR